MRTTVLSQPANGAPADTLRLDLDAGSDSVALQLRPKTHLGALAVRERSRAIAYEGRLADRPGSWVAVTRLGNRWTGIWFDGLHYYGIDSAAALASISPEAAREAPDSSLVFRLSDAVWEGVDFTGDVLHPPKNAEEVLGLVSAEATDPSSQLATLATKRLQIALIADGELNARFGAQTGATMLTLLNNVDGIFANQVGVRLQSASQTIFDTSTQPFTGTTVPETLLTEVRNYRAGSTQQRSAGLSHLMTGRDLDGSTVGIAYLGTLCNSSSSASLSQVSSGTSIFSALIMAHEIGHVFGAPHDGDPDAACATTAADTFVMASQLRSSSQTNFSECSLQQMAPRVTGASCLASADAADAAVEAPQSVLLAVNRAEDVTITVRSVGNVAVNAVNLRVTLPTGVTLLDANGPAASCGARVSNIVDCALGSIAPGAVSTVVLRLQLSAAGAATVGLRVSASNDGLATNNATNLQLQAADGTDLAVTASATPLTLQPDATAVATFVMENRGPAAPGDARLSLTIPAGLSVLQQTSENTVCATVTNGLSCGPSAIAVGGTVRVTLTLRGDVAGSQTVAAAGSSSAPELQAVDNTAQLTLTVASALPVVTPPAATPAPKGGGGAMPPALLAMLALWTALRARRVTYARSK
ncbi:MAG: M12 family metallo-peptidase [Steroidobacteraceae bacterium]